MRSTVEGLCSVSAYLPNCTVPFKRRKRSTHKNLLGNDVWGCTFKYPITGSYMPAVPNRKKDGRAQKTGTVATTHTYTNQQNLKRE